MSLRVQGLIDSIVGYLTVIDRDNLYGLLNNKSVLKKLIKIWWENKFAEKN